MIRIVTTILLSVISLASIGRPTKSNVGGTHMLYGGVNTIPVYTAEDYVQDGLIAMWDGIENAGYGVHDASATIWKDLIGTQDMTLSQYGSFSENSLVCAGGGFAASRGTLFDSFVYAEAVVEYDSLERQNGNIVIWGEYDGMIYYHRSMDLFIYSDMLLQIGGSNLFYSKSATDKLFLLQYSRPDSTDVFALLNGNGLTTTTKTDYWATRYGIGYFGGRQSGYSFRGKIMRVAMYSRIPTASEIAANYAIDQARFNLP